MSSVTKQKSDYCDRTFDKKLIQLISSLHCSARTQRPIKQTLHDSFNHNFIIIIYIVPTGRTSSVLDHLSSIPNGDYSRAGNKKSSVTAHDLEMLLLLLLLMSGVVSS